MRIKLSKLRHLIDEAMSPSREIRWKTAKDGRRWAWVRTASGPEIKIDGEATSVPLSYLQDVGDPIYAEAMGGATVPGMSGYQSVGQDEK